MSSQEGRYEGITSLHLPLRSAPAPCGGVPGWMQHVLTRTPSPGGGLNPQCTATEKRYLPPLAASTAVWLLARVSRRRRSPATGVASAIWSAYRQQKEACGADTSTVTVLAQKKRQHAQLPGPSAAGPPAAASGR